MKVPFSKFLYIHYSGEISVRVSQVQRALMSFRNFQKIGEKNEEVIKKQLT
jgi:hypothetical protein